MHADRNRAAGMRRCWRARFAWLAIVAFLSNALLPSAFAVGIGSLNTDGSSTVRLGFCGAIPTPDAPAKGKPGLLVHHCALCMAAQHVLPPPRQASSVVAQASVDQAFSGHHVKGPSSSLRNYRAQPRAPPAAA